jgi:DNA-binding CsgD family transcriptional regulator
MSAELDRIVEAAYAASDDETWLTHLLEATRPVLDAGLGVIGFFYDMADVDAPVLRPPIMLGTPTGTRDALEQILRDAPRELVRRLHRLVPSCSTMSDRLGLGASVVDLPLHREVLGPLGIADFLGVAATHASGDGCLIGAPLPQVTSIAALDEELLTAVAAHATAGMRMRRQMGKPPLAEEPALPVWAALFAGGWTVVDTFDRQGARFLLAKKRDDDPHPATPAESPLTARENEVVALAAKGRSNKVIAHELGLAPSTVAGHLAKAAAKLGVGSRVELMKAFIQKANVRTTP